MIKLLKYDWKRNSTLILSTLAVLVVLQASLSIVGEIRNWASEIVIVLSALGYISAAMLLFFNCCRTFDHNIKSYSRRLLPLHPLLGTGAVVLLSWLVVIVVVVIAAVHGLIHLIYLGADISEIMNSIQIDTVTVIKLVASQVWTHISLTIVILASITVARSFRIKHSTWIGIVFFFAVMSLMLWLEDLLFENSGDAISKVSVEVTNEPSSFVPSLLSDISIGSIVVETVFAAGLLYLMTYLLNKKVEL